MDQISHRDWMKTAIRAVCGDRPKASPRGELLEAIAQGEARSAQLEIASQRSTPSPPLLGRARRLEQLSMATRRELKDAIRERYQEGNEARERHQPDFRPA